MGKANDKIDYDWGISDEQRARRNRPDGFWDKVGPFIMGVVIILIIVKSCS